MARKEKNFRLNGTSGDFKSQIHSLERLDLLTQKERTIRFAIILSTSGSSRCWTGMGIISLVRDQQFNR
jgi:hypothetical protein